MAPDDPSKTRVFGFSEPRQERIYQNLRLLGDGPAAFYRDSCKIVSGYTGDLDSSSHIVGHLVREIESALRNVLVPIADLKLSEEEKKKNHKSEILAIAAALGISESDAIVQTWLSLANEDYEYATYKVAHREALGPPRPLDSGFTEWWNNIQVILDAVLERFRLHYLKSLELVKKRLATEHPSAADAQFIRQHVPNDIATLAYFFDGCTPDWLSFLRDEGFFRHLPSELPWPQSRYLARIASTKPSEVSEIILQAPDTDNTFVLGDFVGALLAMSAELASKFADKARAWGAYSRDSLLADQLGNLIVHLAKHGYGYEALRVAEGLLAVVPAREGESAPGGSGDSHEDSSPPGATVRPNLWTYEQILKTKIPTLVEAAGLPTLRFLCDLLARSLQLSRSSDQGEAVDYSYIWRRAIEDHAQNQEQGLDSLLVGAIRDAAEKLARKGRSEVLEVVAQLKDLGRPIFRRIELYILSRFKNKASGLVAERLTDRALFDGAEYRHEYSILLGEAFDMLSPEEQKTIFAWIEEGPDVKDIENSEEAQKYVQSWRMRRLYWLKGHLPELWRDRYQKLVEEFGEPEESAKFSAFMQEYVGSRSPMSAEELKALPVAKIVERLKSWEPSPGFMMPSREGLAERLATAVSEEPGRFVADIDLFRAVHPTYVRFLIQSLQNVLAKGQVVDWLRILPFLKWVVDQPVELKNGAGKDRLDEDPDWRGTRRTIAYLLESGFEQKVAGIPFELREAAWETLAVLIRDADPTPEDEARQIRTHEDAAHMSINRTRGIAMHTVVKYALWVEKHMDGYEPISFQKMPEVRVALENGLDEKLEPSLTVRSVYGRWFAWIQHLDSKWASDHVALIFPKDDADLAMWAAAWGSYVCLSPAFSDSLQTLIPEYRLAIDRLGSALPLETNSRNMEGRLAEHLMGFFWHRNLELAGSDGLLGHFWNKAPVELRRTALQEIGRWLHTKEPIDFEILKRLQGLWEWRLEEVSKRQTDPRELSSFSWWFSSGQFDDEWAIDQLEQALKAGAVLEVNFDFLQRLMRMASKMPARAVRCLEVIVRQQKSLWMLCTGHGAEIRAVLNSALRGEGDSAEIAEELINFLASAGLRQFSDLLRS